MVKWFRNKTYFFLKWIQKFTKIDMVYVAKGGFWLSLNQFTTTITSLGLSIVYANFLPKEIYGQYKFILSAMAILGIPTLKSMGTAISQAVARGYDGSMVKALEMKIKWGLWGALASIIMSLYYYWQNDARLAIAFLIIAFFVPLMDSFNIYDSFLSGRKEFKISSQLNVAEKIVNALILFITLLNTSNLFIILIAALVPQNIINFIYYRFIVKKFNPNKQIDPKTISYGFHLSLLGIVNKIAANFDKILLWHFLGPAQIAVYSFAVTPANQIGSVLDNVTTGLAMPKFSAQNEHDIKKTLPAKVLKFFFLIIPIVAAYIIFSPYIFKLIYPKYLDAVWYSQVFFCSLLLLPFYLFGNVFIAKMRKKEIAILRFSSPVIKMILMVILTPIYGIIGLIISLMAAEFLHILLTFILFKIMKTEPTTA